MEDHKIIDGELYHKIQRGDTVLWYPVNQSNTVLEYIAAKLQGCQDYVELLEQTKWIKQRPDLMELPSFVYEILF